MFGWSKAREYRQLWMSGKDECRRLLGEVEDFREKNHKLEEALQEANGKVLEAYLLLQEVGPIISKQLSD